MVPEILLMSRGWIGAQATVHSERREWVIVVGRAIRMRTVRSMSVCSDGVGGLDAV